MSSLQLTLYKHLLNSQLVKSCVRHSTNFSQHLICIGALKKLCNFPGFVYEAVQTSAIIADQIESDKQVSMLDHKSLNFVSCFQMDVVCVIL